MNRYRIFVTILLLLLLAFALRVYRLEGQSAWHDETYCVLIAEQPLAQVVAAQTQDIHPPLYFVLLHFWLPLTGRTDWAVRFLSVIWGVLLVAGLYRAGAGLFDRRAGLVAALLGAVAPFFVAYAQEIRGYALVTLLTLASSYLGYRLLQAPGSKPPTRVWLWGGYVLASAAALYAHYFAALVLIAQNVFFVLRVLWLLASNQVAPGGSATGALRAPRPDRVTTVKHKSRLWIVAQLAVAVLYAPQVLTAVRQLGAYTNPGLRLSPPIESLRGCWQAFNVGLAVDGEWLWPLLTVLAIVFLAGLFVQRDHPFSTCYLSIIFLLPLTLFLLISLNRPLFHPRFLLLIMPSYTLLLAGGVTALWRCRVMMGGLALTVVLIASAWGLNGYYHDERFYKADTRAMAGFLHERATVNDLILVDVEFLFGYYDHGPAPYQYILANDDTTPADLSALCRGRQHLYLVHWQEGVGDPKGLVDYLLRKYGLPLGEWGFRGYQVFGYLIPPEPAFAVGEAYAPRTEVFDGLLRLEEMAYGGSTPDPLNTLVQGNQRIVVPGRPVWVALRWRTLAPLPADYKCFVHLRDATGRQVAGADTLLMTNERQRTSQMPVERSFLDYHLLDTPPDTPAGIYTLYVGLYDPLANARLSVLDANGTPAGTEVVLGTIEVKSDPYSSAAQ